MDIKEFEKHLAKMRLNIESSVSKKLPVIVGARLVEMFKANFQTQSFFDKRWPDVKRRLDPKRYARTPSDAQRLILTGRTGDLGRSIDYEVGDGVVVVKSDKVYSAVHNWGGRAGRGLRSVIPQRQFLGQHPMVMDEIMRIVDKEITKALMK